MRNITLMIKATLLTAQKSGYFTYTSLLVTGMQGDGVSSFPSGGSSSKMAPKKKKGCIYRSSFSYSLLFFTSYFLS
ncbi:CIC_collapsed_G0018150.mRNA.1.CDS.1 [Saccharomyces cerevisiae]|nr:ABA_G0018090.mRNA.1.CDS.1 [Saccharomyces cerevisiae]CAI6481415.1 CIC_HP1_G0016330.mRNA.1.CDS.1 [Saccharomyces cerevisiae]CAI6656329.1 ABA_G0018090.mRNA.1.CDS.1 [Saccharomyces cerevisiae]CAI7285823.1 CIC_collapsed_G0018150.mRNA.1.CDS.1 [Saccharomyces cerevisiae]